MSIQLTWFGHATWQLETDGTKILIDPFFTGNPSAPVSANAVHADYILVSHGHEDHMADAAAIANRCSATLISNYEIATWFARKHRVAKTVGMNLGGQLPLPFGSVKQTLAFHSSQLPDGSNGGNPSGFVVRTSLGNVYFACDTALFGDMQLIARENLAAAILPMGDLFTMGPDDALEAVRLLKPQRVFPSHFNTWPPIQQDAEQWAERVKREGLAEPIVLQPGQTFSW
jgi:L-ascorbate metabolism protein UlaG (beta-lactamase superfamily)